MQNKIPKNLKIPKRNENFLFGIFLYNCIVLVYNTKEKILRRERKICILIKELYI